MSGVKSLLNHLWEACQHRRYLSGKKSLSCFLTSVYCPEVAQVRTGQIWATVYSLMNSSCLTLSLSLLQSCCPSCPACGVQRAASSARARQPRSSSSFRCSSSWSVSRHRRRVSSLRRPGTPAEAAAEPTRYSTPTQLPPTPAPITTPTPVQTRAPRSPAHSTMHTAPSFYSAGITLVIVVYTCTNVLALISTCSYGYFLSFIPFCAHSVSAWILGSAWEHWSLVQQLMFSHYLMWF